MRNDLVEKHIKKLFEEYMEIGNLDYEDITLVYAKFNEEADKKMFLKLYNLSKGMNLAITIDEDEFIIDLKREDYETMMYEEVRK